MNKKPTENELNILSIIWDKGPQTVREIHDSMADAKDVRYTTTLKIMQLMYEKGMLSRTKAGKTHIYEATVSKTSTQKNMVDKLLNTVFKGAASTLAIQALGNQKPTKQELDDIRKYLDSLEDE